MNVVKYVYLKTHLTLVGGFEPTDKVTPQHFHIVIMETGDVKLYPLKDNSVVHLIPSHNIAAITYWLPEVANKSVLVEPKNDKRKRK